jgi:hypothetical protein
VTVPVLRTWVLGLGLALLAGAGAWYAGEYTFRRYKPSDEAASQAYNFVALNREMAQAQSYNGALTFGLLGGLLGLGLGLAGGLTRRSAVGAVIGGLAGLILGTAAGALPALVVMPWQWQHRNDDPSSTELLVPFATHLALWGLVGLAAGVSFAIGVGGARPSRLLAGAAAGLVGAILGTFAFEMIGAFAFPLARTADPFSGTSETRLLARLCVAGFVGLGAIRSLPSGGRARTGKPARSNQPEV